MHQDTSTILANFNSFTHFLLLELQRLPQVTTIIDAQNFEREFDFRWMRAYEDVVFYLKQQKWVNYIERWREHLKKIAGDSKDPIATILRNNKIPLHKFGFLPHEAGILKQIEANIQKSQAHIFFAIKPDPLGWRVDHIRILSDRAPTVATPHLLLITIEGWTFQHAHDQAIAFMDQYCQINAGLKPLWERVRPPRNGHEAMKQIKLEEQYQLQLTKLKDRIFGLSNEPVRFNDDSGSLFDQMTR